MVHKSTEKKTVKRGPLCKKQIHGNVCYLVLKVYDSGVMDYNNGRSDGCLRDLMSAV